MTTHVITGAGSGIGRIVAERLHARGDQLVVVARDAARATELTEAFPGSIPVVADLARPETIAEAVQDAGVPASVDALIHAAGIVDVLPGAAGTLAGHGGAVVVELQGHAHRVVAGAGQGLDADAVGLGLVGAGVVDLPLLHQAHARADRCPVPCQCQRVHDPDRSWGA